MTAPTLAGVEFEYGDDDEKDEVERILQGKGAQRGSEHDTMQYFAAHIKSQIVEAKADLASRERGTHNLPATGSAEEASVATQTPQSRPKFELDPIPLRTLMPEVSMFVYRYHETAGGPVIMSTGKEWNRTVAFITDKQKDNDSLSIPQTNDLIVSINGVRAVPGMAGGSSDLMVQLE